MLMAGWPVGGMLLVVAVACSLSSGCSEDKPKRAAVSLLSGEAAEGDYSTSRLTVNGKDCVGAPVVVRPKEPLELAGEVDLARSSSQFPHGQYLVHVVEYRGDLEVSASSGTPTVSGQGSNRLTFTCDLPAPADPGTFEIRLSGRLSDERRVTVCEGHLKVQQSP